MSTYRIPCLASDDRVMRDHFDAMEDAKAFELVRIGLEPFDCEICGVAKVAILLKDGGARRLGA